MSARVTTNRSAQNCGGQIFQKLYYRTDYSSCGVANLLLIAYVDVIDIRDARITFNYAIRVSVLYCTIL
jgi:hypothetical protein